MPCICDFNQKSSDNQDFSFQNVLTTFVFVCMCAFLTSVSVAGTILVIFGGMTQISHSRILRFNSPQSIAKHRIFCLWCRIKKKMATIRHVGVVSWKRLKLLPEAGAAVEWQCLSSVHSFCPQHNPQDKNQEQPFSQEHGSQQTLVSFFLFLFLTLSTPSVLLVGLIPWWSPCILCLVEPRVLYLSGKCLPLSGGQNWLFKAPCGS